MADTELPQSQSSWRQWRAVGLIGVALSAPLAAGYFYFLRPQYAPLFSNLRTEEAAAIVTELKRQSIPYKLADGGGAVLVEKTRVDAARVALSGSDLSIHGLDGFELFNDSDMGLTEFAQRIRYQRALQGELARTILKIDGVADVRVHISLPERTMFEAEADRPKAAVSLTLRGSGTSNGDQVLGIQRLVAASVDGLALADVVVLDSSGRVISPADPSAPSNAVAEARAAAPVATPRRDGAGEREAGGGVAGSKAVSPTGETAGGRPAGERGGASSAEAPGAPASGDAAPGQATPAAAGRDASAGDPPGDASADTPTADSPAASAATQPAQATPANGPGVTPAGDSSERTAGTNTHRDTVLARNGPALLAGPWRWIAVAALASSALGVGAAVWRSQASFGRRRLARDLKGALAGLAGGASDAV